MTREEALKKLEAGEEIKVYECPLRYKPEPEFLHTMKMDMKKGGLKKDEPIVYAMKDGEPLIVLGEERYEYYGELLQQGKWSHPTPHFLEVPYDEAYERVRKDFNHKDIVKFHRALTTAHIYYDALDNYVNKMAEKAKNNRKSGKNVEQEERVDIAKILSDYYSVNKSTIQKVNSYLGKDNGAYAKFFNDYVHNGYGEGKDCGFGMKELEKFSKLNKDERAECVDRLGKGERFSDIYDDIKDNQAEAYDNNTREIMDLDLSQDYGDREVQLTASEELPPELVEEISNISMKNYQIKLSWRFESTPAMHFLQSAPPDFVDFIEARMALFDMADIQLPSYFMSEAEIMAEA